MSLAGMFYLAPICGQAESALAIAIVYAVAMGSFLIAFFVRNRRLKHRAEEKRARRRAALQVAAATRRIRHPKTIAMLVPVALVGLHFLNRQDRKDG